MLQIGVGVAAQSAPEHRESVAGAYTQIGSEVYTGDGLARCRKDDRFSPKVGEAIALGRALQALGKAIEDKWVARSACEVDVQRRRNGGSTEQEIQDQVTQGYLDYIESMRGRPMQEIVHGEGFILFEDVGQ